MFFTVQESVPLRGRNHYKNGKVKRGGFFWILIRPIVRMFCRKMGNTSMRKKSVGTLHTAHTHLSVKEESEVDSAKRLWDAGTPRSVNRETVSRHTVGAHDPSSHQGMGRGGVSLLLLAC